MSDLPERLRVNACRYAHETEDQAAQRRIQTDLEAANEIERLRERLGPRGLEVVMIDGAGHYVSEKVKAEIDRLREENSHFRAATVAAMTLPSDQRGGGA